MNKEPGDIAGRDEDDALHTGSAEWLRAQWQQHRRWVAAVILAHKPKWAEVDDLLQDVAAAFVRKGAELRDPHSVRPWLRTVAINAAHLAARTGKRRSDTISLDAATSRREFVASGSSTNVSQRAMEREDSSDLLRLAGEIPDGYREPLLLKAVQGMSYRQIGAVMGLPESTVETRIARARKMLRELAEHAARGDSQSLTERAGARISFKETPASNTGTRTP